MNLPTREEIIDEISMTRPAESIRLSMNTFDQSVWSPLPLKFTRPTRAEFVQQDLLQFFYQSRQCHLRIPQIQAAA